MTATPTAATEWPHAAAVLRRGFGCLLAWIGILVLAGPVLAAAAEPTVAQRRCLTAMSKAEAAVASLTGKNASRCLRAAHRGRLAGDAIGQCLAGESPALKRAKARSLAAAAKFCGSPADFGPRDGDVVNLAMAKVVDVSRMFGADLAAAIKPLASDTASAGCQATIFQQVNALAQAEIAEYQRCSRALLKQQRLTSAADLQACLAGADLAAVREAAAQRVAAQCTDLDFEEVCPGQCATAKTAAELAPCLAAEAHCGACSAVNAADGLSAGCHTYQNGTAQYYCGTRPPSTRSVARQWDEEILDAIRIDNPRPPVHARNLFHLSVAMYDAWAAYGHTARAYLTAEHPQSADPERDRDVAVSFAAYRVLAERYAAKLSLGAATSQVHFARRMNQLGYDPGFTDIAGDSPAALGNRIGAAVIAYGLSDGSNEYKNYTDPTYEPKNLPLIVKVPGIDLTDPRDPNDPNDPGDPNYRLDPNRWQPLALDKTVSQNGIPLPDKIQTAIGSHWGDVIPFAMYRVPEGQLYHTLNEPPALGGATEADVLDQAMELIELSSLLTATGSATVDISPKSMGNNELGSNEGTGYSENPATGQPYAANEVLLGDFGRVLAEFWADGPTSETPPGHWNVFANAVADSAGFERRIGGSGPSLSPLEWDVKVYFALNGAVHDAAIEAWGAKRRFDTVRPITLIRYLAKTKRLPLRDGLVEEITEATAAAGGRHAHLVTAEAGGKVGDIAIYNWPGSPADTANQVAGIQWVLGTAWVPYQRNTFVTPAFPAYISGHSTFSRAAADLLARFTGSEFFPGGLMEYVVRQGSLIHEDGPSADVRLQWARYFDAADQAGRSRLWGGIHIRADDFEGRRIGHQIGLDAYAKAASYFSGQPTP